MQEIVGRDSELEAIERWLDLPRPYALLIEGEAGIGKTTLWRTGVERARVKGYRVLVCSAAGSEAQISFTSLRDLLDDAFDEIADALPAPQRHALGVVLLREEPEDAPPEQGAISVAFLSAVRALARAAPVLIAVDDIQWLDPDSAVPLRYALRRLDSENVGMLVALRPDDEHRDPLELDRLDSGRLAVVRLAPLTIGALARMLHGRLGIGFPRPTLHRIQEVSGGNPFFALELARALGPAPPLAPGAPLPVPASLHELVDGRLAALPDASFDALAVAAVASRPTVELLAAALGTDPWQPLDAAVAAHLVTHEGSAVLFTHPLYAAAVYDLVSPARRRALHERLAEIATDLEERARHLALATLEPAAEIAAKLEAGSAAAHTRGSPAAAAELVSEATRLTPREQQHDARRRALLEAQYRFEAGETSTATAVLDELLASEPRGTERARLLSRQARYRHFGDGFDGGVDLLLEALEQTREDAALRCEIHEGLVWGLMRRDATAAAQHAEAAVELAETLSDPVALAESLAARGLIEFIRGIDATASLERALELEEHVLPLRVLRHPSFVRAYCLCCADELDDARAVFDELARRAGENGDESALAHVQNHLALVAILSGDWVLAARLADDGHAIAVQTAQRPSEASTLGKRALVAAFRGEVDEARVLADRALGSTFDPSAPARAIAGGGEGAIWALGHAALAAGEPEEAHRYLGPLAFTLLAIGLRDPGELRSVPDEVETLIELGRLDEAETLLQPFEDWSARLDRRSALATAGRCRGLLLVSAGDVDGAIAALETAAVGHEQAPLPFERARTLLALGAERRRARRRREARETLGRALAIFEELGAAAFAARTRAEISRIGGRAPSPGGLTPTEEQVAALVAEGKSNKEVAAELIVSVHTVEAALTSIYRKLDIRSRTELAVRSRA